MRPEDDGIQTEHVPADLKLLLHGPFGDSVGIFRAGNHVLGHRKLTRSVDRDGRCKHKTFHRMIDAIVNQIDASQEIILVIEPFDKVTQPFRGVRRKMIHKPDRMIGKKRIQKISIQNAGLNIQNQHVESGSHKILGNM
jgi:hypothetical protein